MNWKEFETACTNYCNQNFGELAYFTQKGGSLSDVPDILVKTKKGAMFYIEVKHSPAQCGQFVLLPNMTKRTFEYSSKNGNKINEYSKIIMNYMNQYFDAYCKAGTGGREIRFANDTSVFTNWVITTYKQKNVRYFITNHYTILPIDRFGDYFTISAVYRIKRSGSNNVGYSRFATVKQYLFSQNYTNITTQGEKLFVSSPKPLHNKRFLLNNTEYMFSKRENKYEIRRLSNTFNANVIFSIEQKESVPGMSKADFAHALQTI